MWITYFEINNNIIKFKKIRLSFLNIHNQFFSYYDLNIHVEFLLTILIHAKFIILV